MDGRRRGGVGRSITHSVWQISPVNGWNDIERVSEYRPITNLLRLQDGFREKMSIALDRDVLGNCHVSTIEG